MAHYQKYTISQIGHLLQHDERVNTYLKENIDPTLTENNFIFLPEVNSQNRLHELLDKSKKSGGRIKSDSVVCCSCVITLPKEMMKEDSYLFFSHCKEYLDMQHGEDNCISCIVHYDEPNGRPHLHYKFVPLESKVKTYKDGHTKNILQLNAKKLISRTYLQRFHKGLDSYLKEIYGYNVGVVNGATKTRKDLKKEYDVLCKDYDDLVDEYNDLIDEHNKYNDILSKVKYNGVLVADIVHNAINGYIEHHKLNDKSPQQQQHNDDEYER